MRSRSGLLFAFALPVHLAAQDVSPPPDSVLAGITARGRLMAAYDQAAWHGTDAMLATLRNPEGIEGFLAREDAQGRWSVLFGRLTATQDVLLIVVTATQQEAPDRFSAAVHTPPRVGTDEEQRAFRAMTTARADLQASPRLHQGAYNSYVLPQSNGGWLVYFLPAQTQVGVYPHGSDFRYEISADGARIVARHQMHRAVMMTRLPANAVMGVHTVVTADLPQDSDVFLVLARTPRRPELVVTDHFEFEIQTDGIITWRPRRDDDRKR